VLNISVARVFGRIIALGMQSRGTSPFALAAAIALYLELFPACAALECLHGQPSFTLLCAAIHQFEMWYGRAPGWKPSPGPRGLSYFIDTVCLECTEERWNAVNGVPGFY